MNGFLNHGWYGVSVCVGVGKLELWRTGGLRNLQLLSDAVPITSQSRCSWAQDAPCAGTSAVQGRSWMAEPNESKSGADAAALIEKLTQQRDLYVELMALGAEQAELIASGETERLLQVLARRQQHVARLGELNVELAAARQGVGELGPGQRDQVNGLLAEVERLLEQIIAQDDRDRQQLASARDDVATQMRQATHAGKAVNAYAAGAAAGSAGARFTDGRG